MDRLQAQLNRLYHPQPDLARGPLSTEHLFDAHGRTRALVLEWAAPADWPAVARLWEGVQADLQLPAPGIAVNGLDGYQLWFSLSEAVAPDVAQAVLEALRARYWQDLPQAATRVRSWPMPASAPTASRHARPVPALHERSGQWSAFVSRDLAPVFAETPWLDIAPSPDGQADLLASLSSLKPETLLRTVASASEVKSPPPGATPSGAASPTSANAPQRDPRAFLLAVMNDADVDLPLRIEAAKALLQAPGRF